MTIILRLEYSVPDFDEWKKVFDSDPLNRQKSGVRRYRILRPVDDPKYVMVEIEFDDSSKAEAFRRALSNLWLKVQDKVLDHPQLRIFEEVESKEY
jgi:heme-degrading monooxygenase HmoA